jgi:hypothetical protein
LDCVHLKDIFNHLENSANVNNAPLIDENKSLWEAIEFLQLQDKNLLQVKNGDTGEIKHFGYNSLFTGLEALKLQSHE